MVKRRMRTAVGLTLSLSLLLSLLSGATAGAKKAKIKKSGNPHDGFWRIGDEKEGAGKAETCHQWKG